MSKKWDVFVFGDVNIDLVIPGVSHLPLPGQEDEVEVMETFAGGGAALFALGVAKLGVKTVFQGSVGDDLYGAFIVKEFGRVGLDTELLKIDTEKKTGISISFTNEKDRSFLTMRGTNEGLSLAAMDMEQAVRARHVHMTGYSGTANHESYLKTLKSLKEDGQTTVSFDVGWDSSGEWYEGIYELFPYIDVLFMNEEEAVHYSGKNTAEEAAADFAGTAGMAVVKLGKRGSFAVKGGRSIYMPGYKVRAVDTTGAGDSFNAGFVYGYVSGCDMEECLRCGNGCGALSVTRLGGNTGFPDRGTLERFIKGEV